MRIEVGTDHPATIRREELCRQLADETKPDHADGFAKCRCRTANSLQGDRSERHRRGRFQVQPLRDLDRQVGGDVVHLCVVCDACARASDALTDCEGRYLVADLHDRSRSRIPRWKAGCELSSDAVECPLEALLARDLDHPFDVFGLFERPLVERQTRELDVGRLRSRADAGVRHTNEQAARADAWSRDVLYHRFAPSDEDLLHETNSFHHNARLRRHQVSRSRCVSTYRMTSLRSSRSVCRQSSSRWPRALACRPSKSHSRTGTAKPCFGRSISSSGISPRTDFLRMCFSVPLFVLTRSGMLIANSTNLWSRNGTRPSRLVPMLILSMRISRSSGMRILRST